MASGAAINLEGITLQHVGELVFRAPETRAIRRASRANYLHSLEDFAFAVVLADKLVVGERFPSLSAQPGAKPGDAPPSPAERLIWDLPSDLLSRVRIPDNKALAHQLVLLDSFRKEILSDVRRLPVSIAQDVTYWEAYFRREAVYLGDHEALRDPSLPLIDYAVGEHYLRDSDLWAAVPRSVIEAGLPIVSERASRSRHVGFLAKPPQAPRALEALVAGSVVSHVAFMHAYDLAIVSQPEPPVRLPFATRCSILEARLKEKRPGARSSGGVSYEPDESVGAESLRQLRDASAPLVLLAALDGPCSPRRLPERLVAARGEDLFRRLRTFLSPILASLVRPGVALDAGQQREAERLISELTGRSEFVSPESEDLRVLRIRSGVLPQKLLELLPTALQGRSLQGALLARQLKRRAGYADQEEYLRRLGQVFPELDPSKPWEPVPDDRSS
jgi:hypothetical protein